MTFCIVKVWEQKEEAYKRIIENLRSKEVDDWTDTYQTLLDKVENLKQDIDNIVIE